MKIIVVTQARIGSTRLPGKILKKIKGKSLLEIHLNRILRSSLVNEVVVATTNETGVEKICEIADHAGVKHFKGDLNDVLDRFYQAVVNLNPDYVVRLTSDCPLIDPVLIDNVINHCLENNADYCSNVLKEEFPDGQDVEVMRFSALEKAWKEAKLPSEREHVTPFIRKNCDYAGGQLFHAVNFDAPDNLNHVRMTVDEEKDFSMMETVIQNLGTDKSWVEYSNFIISNTQNFENQNIIRNEGYIKSLKNDRN